MAEFAGTFTFYMQHKSDTNITDNQLVKDVQKGDKHAFDQLVTRYHSKVFKLVSHLVQNREEAEDITQDIFIKVYTFLNNFRGDSTFYTWLYRVAINTTKNYLILQGRRPTTMDMDLDLFEKTIGHTLLKDLNTPEDLALTDEIQVCIFKTLENMSDEIKLAFVLREIEDLSYEDISDVLECPVGTVRSRIFRAREMIDKEIGSFFEK